MEPSAKRLTITIGILVGMFLAALEATVVGTAMPTVVASLGGLEIYSWVFSAYLLSSTVTVPAWGKLSDLYGRRPFYLLAIAIFLLGSILSGQAQSMSQLIAFRVVQGLGAGGESERDVQVEDPTPAEWSVQLGDDRHRQRQESGGACPSPGLFQRSLGA